MHEVEQVIKAAAGIGRRPTVKLGLHPHYPFPGIAVGSLRGGPVNLVGAARWIPYPPQVPADVMAFDLIVLGRQLTRIGETEMRGQGPPSQPTLAGMVLADVFAHPRSSISEITARVGMPQSHVSETVARMREQGTVETFPDPGDRRRTLVRINAQHPEIVMRAALVPVDAALTAALGDLSPDDAADIIKSLEALAARLRPDKPGPILERLNRERTQE